MKFNPLKTALIGGALGGAMLIGAVTLGPAGAADKATTTTVAKSGTDSDHNGNHGRHMGHLTEAQKKCLADAGIEKPQGRPTEAHIKATQAAAKKCGITMPAGMGHGGMHHRGNHHPRITEAQKKCLADAGFTKPETKPTTRPTAERMKAFHAAAKKCGITMPDGMGHGGMHHGGKGHHGDKGQHKSEARVDA